MTVTSPELVPTQAIELDDVLESAFLDADPYDPQAFNVDPDSRKHLKNLSRWDLISVGAFRQTREAGGLGDNTGAGWGSDTPVSNDFGSLLKSSPLSSMMWQNKKVASTRRMRNMNAVVSPSLLPVRDGDRTPTNASHAYTPPPEHNVPHKTRKELRHERKLKRKSHDQVRNPPQHRQHQHHHGRQHHPNQKTRSSSSSQRMNFFNSSSPVPPLSI